MSNKITTGEFTDGMDMHTHYNSIIEALHKNRVVKIKKNEEGNFIVKEQCDNYYCIELKPEQLLQLSDEIRDFALNSLYSKQNDNDK